MALFVVCSCRISGSVSGFARTYPPPTRSVRARPRSCSFEAPARPDARVANPTKRAPSDAPRADRASAAQPTVEVAATGRRRPRAICHTERTSECQNVQASAECVRPMWSRWRPCVLAALAGRGARVRDSGRASRRHARPRAPSCTTTVSHALPPILPVAAPAGGLGRAWRRACFLEQNYAQRCPLGAKVRSGFSGESQCQLAGHACSYGGRSVWRERMRAQTAGQACRGSAARPAETQLRRCAGAACGPSLSTSQSTSGDRGRCSPLV